MFVGPQKCTHAVQCESDNFTSLKFLNVIFIQRLKLLKPYFTCIFRVQDYTKLLSFIQLFLNLMKLCHIMHAQPENFLFSLKAHSTDRRRE